MFLINVWKYQKDKSKSLWNYITVSSKPDLCMSARSITCRGKISTSLEFKECKASTLKQMYANVKGQTNLIERFYDMALKNTEKICISNINFKCKYFLPR